MNRLMTDAEAHYILQGNMHKFWDHTTEGTKRMAFLKIREMADKGYPEAKCDYAVLIQDGYCINKDPERAFKMIKELAETQYSKAEYLLGRCYEEGEGTTKNIKEAVRWYLLAAEHRDASAISKLSEMYNLGFGEEITDSVETLEIKAAFCEYKESMYRIAKELFKFMWELNKGMMWMQQAAANNCSEAIEFMNNYSDEDLRNYKLVMEKLNKLRMNLK